MAQKVYRKGTIKCSQRWGGGAKVDYKIVKSPKVILGASLFLRAKNRKWQFYGNVRPSISRSGIRGMADTYVFNLARR